MEGKKGKKGKYENFDGNRAAGANLNAVTILTLSLIIGLFALTIISLKNVSAQPMQQVNYTVSSASQGLTVTQLDYSPFPANPGEYFDLWISAQYIGSQNAQTAVFQLQPSFPFSLDPNESTNQTVVLVGGQNILVHYKVKLDPNAVQGDNELDLLYTTDPTGNVWGLKKLDVSVANAQTTFATVMQPSAASQGYSFSIVNTGENTANSVIVQIPSQSDFRVIGTNGQVVGNLAAGDYTVVNFDIVPTYLRNSGSSGTGFAPGGAAGSQQNLTVEIDYTDNIGVRRSVFDTLDFNPSLAGAGSNITGFTTAGGAGGNGVYFRRSASSSGSGSIFSSIWFWLFVIAVAGGLAFYYKKHPEEVKGIFSRSHKAENSAKGKRNREEPEWVLAERKRK